MEGLLWLRWLLGLRLLFSLESLAETELWVLRESSPLWPSQSTQAGPWEYANQPVGRSQLGTAHLEPGAAWLEIDWDKYMGVPWGQGAKADKGGPPAERFLGRMGAARRRRAVGVAWMENLEILAP